VTRAIGGYFVHAYTASGVGCGWLALVAAIHGDARTSLLWLVAATFIDATDGVLARIADVARTAPAIDGARLDDIVDYITYAFAPMVLLWTGDYLPAGTPGMVLAALPLLASSFQFCRADAKTEDHCFLGFPSYWNVVAFYVIVLGLSPTVTAVILVLGAALVFVPIKYLYPSRTNVFRALNLTLAGLWLVLYAVILAGVPHPNRLAVGLSLAYVAYYFVTSVYVTVRRPYVRAGG
jgi:phosphatidylcholine synthase